MSQMIPIQSVAARVSRLCNKTCADPSNAASKSKPAAMCGQNWEILSSQSTDEDTRLNAAPTQLGTIAERCGEVNHGTHKTHEIQGRNKSAGLICLPINQRPNPASGKSILS